MNFINYNEIYLLINLKDNFISFKCLTRKSQSDVKLLNINNNLVLWDIFASVKDIINKEKINDPNVIIVGYKLEDIFKYFRNSKIISNKVDDLKKRSCEIAIPTKTHAKDYYKFKIKIKLRDIANLMSEKDDLNSFLKKGKYKNEIQFLQDFVGNWFSLLKELNRTFNLNFKELPISCISVSDIVVNQQLINDHNPKFYELLKQKVRDNEWDIHHFHSFIKSKKLSENNIDWKIMRQGYFFDKEINYKDKKRLNVELATEAICPDTYAKDSYYGGQSGDYIYGKIDDSLLLDIDLKAAYNTNGHLIPDFFAGLHWEKVKNCNFKELVSNNNLLINGPFTIGYAECKITYPKDSKIILTPCRVGGNTKYLQQCDHIKITLTDAYAAFLNGAEVYVYDCYIPQQEKLNCDDKSYLKKLSPYGKVQDFFLKKREENQNNEILNKLYKLLGNDVYGKSAQGIRNNNNFSKISNLYIPAQYTAITRLLVSYLINFLLNHYNDAELITVTTDGFLMKFNKNRKIKEIQHYLQNEIEKCDLDLWKYVGNTFFNKTFFEIKHATKADLMVIRASFKISSDGVIHAMSGMKKDNYVEVYNEFLKTISDKNKRKDHINFKYSFNRRLSKFHKGKDKIGYFESIPFKDRSELERYKKSALKIIESYNIYENKYGEAFIQTMNEYIANRNGKWVNKYPIATSNYNKLNYLRYIAKKLDKYSDEEKIKNLRYYYNTYFRRYYYRFNSFKKCYNRTVEKINTNLINYLAVVDAQKEQEEFKRSHNYKIKK